MSLLGNPSLFSTQQSNGSSSLFSNQNVASTNNSTLQTNTFQNNNQQQLANNGSHNNASNGSSNVANTPWFNNPKKRIIPNHLVPKKKSGFQIVNNTKEAPSSSSSKKGGDKKSLSQSTKADPFNLISFGSSSTSSAAGRNASTSIGSLFDASIGGDLTKYDETINDTIHEDSMLDNVQDDAPPSRSIYDLSNDVLTSLNEPTNLHLDSFLNKDPKSFNNVFNKNAESDSKDKLKDFAGEDLKIEDQTSAILVFGYPESMANQVIQHFQNYGNVLEDFEATKSKHQLTKYYQQQIVSTKGGSSASNSIVPLFTGNSWVKLTYSNSSDAINALRENGTVFNGVLLGVIPYNKNAIEKLEKRKLTPGEDIGGDLESTLYLTNPKVSEMDSAHNLSSTTNPTNSATTNANATDQSTYINRIDIKDGSGFFLHSNNVTDPSKAAANSRKDGKEGIISSVTKYLFGINEL